MSKGDGGDSWDRSVTGLSSDLGGGTGGTGRAGEGHKGHQHHVVWCDSPRASQEAVPSHRARVAFLAAGSFLAWLFQHLI